VIGDSGTGGRQQYEVARRWRACREQFPFELVLMLGDNLYGPRETSEDYARKFERPYKPLLDAGACSSDAALRLNHDLPSQRSYAPSTWAVSAYYTFTRRNVQFFALGLHYMDRHSSREEMVPSLLIDRTAVREEASNRIEKDMLSLWTDPCRWSRARRTARSAA